MAVKFFWKKNTRKTKQNTHLKQKQKQNPETVQDAVYNEQQRTQGN